MKEKLIEKIKEELLEMAHLKSAIAVLYWDQDVFMPEKGINSRSETISSLTSILHSKLVSKKFENLIKEANKFLGKGLLSKEEECVIREVWREFEREKKLPASFVKELTILCSRSQEAWKVAKEKSDFRIFLPYFKKIIELKRKETKLVGYKKSPYDALIDTFEPEMTTEEYSILFNDLKKFLISFVKKIGESKVKISQEMLKGNFSDQKQFELSKLIIERMGFNFNGGRLDTSVHPFSTSFSPDDVRITTRFIRKDLLNSLFSTIHETGHAFYEQGILTENFGTPMGESISLGMHESQSKMWENLIGRNKSFWKYFYPELRRRFSKTFAKIKIDDFYKLINSVRPSLIRIESDEVTYNLHIILRFELEKELIEGSIECEDLPKIWADKMKEYLNVDVPNDAKGVLQDVHWSMGNIGYFPTYILGNLYASQFYAKMKNAVDIENNLSKGNFKEIKEWLRKNIHIHGKLYTAEKLAQKVTGEKLNSKYFIEYLENKYSEIYKIKK